MGSYVNNTMSVRMIDQPLQTISYKHVLSEGNYTAASITAVDLCGQRSAPTQFELTNTTAIHVSFPGVDRNDAQQSNSSVAVGAVLGVLLCVITIIAAALSAVLSLIIST